MQFLQPVDILINAGRPRRRRRAEVEEEIAISPDVSLPTYFSSTRVRGAPLASRNNHDNGRRSLVNCPL